MASKVLVKNMGSLDRAVRAFLVAPVAVATAFTLGTSALGSIGLFVVAGIALVTAASGRCPAYVLFGIDTRGGARAPLPH